MKRVVLFLLLTVLAVAVVFAADTTGARRPLRRSHTPAHATAAHRRTVVRRVAPAHRRTVARRYVRRTAHARLTSATLTRRRVHRRYLRHRYYERFTADSFATTDLTAGDVIGGEDPVVRQAAIDALGNMNGTVVAIDPASGRVLAMVNQKLALSSGAEPCSTIKLSVALAALSEGIITEDTPVNLGGHYYLNLTEALAHSNNLYFETLGRRLGFDRVRHYATEFGLGELAGWNIPGEKPGLYPDQPIPASEGGVGRMCSFGEGVSLTPLQLGALVAAIANGGTLYYLQHPTTPQEIADFQPRIKRTLDISRILPSLQDGMAAVVRYGTARSLRVNFTQFPVLGKTGTCSDDGTRFGWFASYADAPSGKVAVVFFLEGGRATYGPRAAELAGVFYRDLWNDSYFVAKQPLETSAADSVTSSPAGDPQL